MGIEIERTTGRGEILPLQLTSSSFGFGNCRITHYAAGNAIVGDTGGAWQNLWVNPESVEILIFRIVINITTNVGGAITINVGSDADGTGLTGDVVMTNMDTSAAGWFDNCFGPCTTPAPILHLDAPDGDLSYVTCLFNNDNAGVTGAVYIFYFPLL